METVGQQFHLSDLVGFNTANCCAMSRKHLQTLGGIEPAWPVPVSDAGMERGNAFVARFASNGAVERRVARTCLDYQSTLEDTDVNAVIVARLSRLHARIGLDLLDVVKHVPIEGSLALVISLDPNRLIEKAQEAKRCQRTIRPNGCLQDEDHRDACLVRGGDQP